MDKEILDRILDLTSPYLPKKIKAQQGGYMYVKDGDKLPIENYIGIAPPDGYILKKVNPVKAGMTAFDKNGLVEKIAGSQEFDKKYYEALLALASAAKSATSANHRLATHKKMELIIAKYRFNEKDYA